MLIYRRFLNGSQQKLMISLRLLSWRTGILRFDVGMEWWMIVDVIRLKCCWCLWDYLGDGLPWRWLVSAISVWHPELALSDGERLDGPILSRKEWESARSRFRKKCVNEGENWSEWCGNASSLLTRWGLRLGNQSMSPVTLFSNCNSMHPGALSWIQGDFCARTNSLPFFKTMTAETMGSVTMAPPTPSHIPLWK